MPKDFYNHCARKVRHETRRLAQDAADETRRKTGVAMDAYKCQYCEGFHVGHASKRRERLRKVTR